MLHHHLLRGAVENIFPHNRPSRHMKLVLRIFISAGLKGRSEKTPRDSGGMKAEPLRPTIRYIYLG